HRSHTAREEDLVRKLTQRIDAQTREILLSVRTMCFVGKPSIRHVTVVREHRDKTLRCCCLHALWASSTFSNRSQEWSSNNSTTQAMEEDSSIQIMFHSWISLILHVCADGRNLLESCR